MEIHETTAAEENRNLPGKPTTLWFDNTPETHFPVLEKDLLVDTVIVGGGIAGITTATLLKDAGQRVAVIEARKIVTGVTGHSTAKITSLHGLIYQHLHSHFGEEGARVYADANQTAIETMASLIETKRIACDFQKRSAYTYTDTEKDLDKVAKEVQIARSLGLPASYVEATSLPFAVKGAICLTNQAQFHPRKFVLHLAEELHKAGCAIFEETRALDIVEGDIVEAITDKGVIRGKKVVVASHFPFKDPAFFFARMYPKRSYVLAARIRGTLPDGMFYSTSEPYVSVRSHPTDKGDILLIGGQNHKTGHVRHTSELYRAVERLARQRFDVESIEYRWSTQDNVTLDRVPYIGRISPLSQHVYVATGFAGWGIAHSMVAAIILSDAILGRSNPWAMFYDPLRIKLRDTSKLVTQNLHAVKHLAIERLIASDSFDVKTLPKEAGGVIKAKLKSTAVARDDKGDLHAVSPACTHMKCIVTWNDAEQSWDCPCHGSRFSIDGAVIHGPALKPLEKKAP